MAYDPQKLKDREERDSANPYDAMTSSYGGATGSIASPARADGSFAPKAEGNGYMAGAGGPTATGYVNFDSLYNANAGVSTREAGKRNDAAQAAGAKATQGRTGAVQAFGDAARTGTTTAPGANAYGWAAQGATGVQQGKKVTDAYTRATEQSNVQGPAEAAAPQSAANTGIAGGGKENGSNALNTGIGGRNAPQPATPPPPQQSYVTEEQEGLTSPVTRTSGAETPEDPTDDTFYDTTGDAALEAEVRKGAGAKYAGPDALDKTDGYDDLLKETVAAQQLAQDPLTGLNDTDRALLGAAGRPKFADTASKYGGLTKDLEAANVASRGTANEARRQTDEAADLYEQLLAKYEGRQADEQANVGDGSQVLAAAEKDKADRIAYRDAMDSKDPFRNTLHDVAGFFSPSDNVTEANGVKSPLDAATNWFGEQYLGDDATGFKPGNVSKAWGEDDADVFASMSPSDWAEFNKMSERDQRAWIAARKAKLRGGK